MRPSESIYEETPTFIPAGEGKLFTVFCQPLHTTPTAGVILLPGGSQTSTNKNRLSVTWSRRLASNGFASLRFDYHGVGESTGEYETFRLDRPFASDVRAAAEWMEKVQGVPRLVLIGSCFGARSALAAANLPNVDALVMMAPPLRDFAMGELRHLRSQERSLGRTLLRGLRPSSLRRLRHARVRAGVKRILGTKVRQLVHPRNRVTRGPVSENFLRPLARLAASETPVLLLFGHDDDSYRDFERALNGNLGKLLSSSPSITVHVRPGHLHGFPNVDTQNEVMDFVDTWLHQPDESPSLSRVGTAHVQENQWTSH